MMMILLLHLAPLTWIPHALCIRVILFGCSHLGTSQFGSFTSQFGAFGVALQLCPG